MATENSLFDIKQITNYDLEDTPSISMEITLPQLRDKEVVMEPVRSEYKTAVEGVNIVKLGYCTEPKGHIYPIFLQIRGKYYEIQVGKNGMYEVQMESFNDDDVLANIKLTGVRVPANVKFTLDYAIEV